MRARATSSRFPRSRSALLIVDVINPLDFPGGDAVARQAVRTAQRIAALASRARRSGVPVVYVNDNLGRWRSHLDELIGTVTRRSGPGAALVDRLRPEKSDFVVLKSTLSGFYATPLHAMLQLGAVRSVIVTGLLTGNCVLFTAADAYMRNYEVVIPSDCVIDLTHRHQRAALETMKDVLKARVIGSQTLRLRR